MDLRLQTINQSKVEIVQKVSGESEIPVAAASIISKKIFEDYLKKLESEFKISNLKRINPETLDPRILFHVAKIHFKNIDSILRRKDKNYETNVKSREQQLINIIQRGENEQVEFKSLIPKEKRNIGKKFIGMINSTLLHKLEPKEVYLFIGINDDGTPCGIETTIADAVSKGLITQKTKRSLQQFIINLIKDKSDPKIIPHAEYFFYNDHEILVLTHEVSDTTIVSYGGKYYLLAGDNLDEIPPNMIKNYYKELSK